MPDEDPLAPARGILFGCAICIPVWIVGAILLWYVMR